MVDTDGYFYVIGYLGFDAKGPILNIFKYKPDGTYDGTRTGNIEPWTHFCSGQIDTTPNLSDDTEKTRFKNYIYSTLQPMLAQEIGFSDSNLWTGAYIPPHKYRSAKQDTYYGGFGAQQIARHLGSAPYCPCYADSVFTGTYVYSFPTVNFARIPKLRNSDSYVISNGWPNFKIFRYQYNGSTYVCLYQVAQNRNDNGSHDVFFIKGNQYFQTTEEGTGTGICTNTNGTSGAFQNVHVTMTPRIFKIGSYLYSTFQVNGCCFHLCRQPLSELSLIRKTGINSWSHYVETSDTLVFKRTSYSYDFCFLEGDGTPCTFSTPDNVRKIWCILCFGSSYDSLGELGNLNADLGWSSTQCSNFDGQVACVLRSYYLPADDGNNWGGTGDWIQNAIYFTDAKPCEDKTTIAGVSDSNDNKYQIHYNTHRMVTYHSPAGKNYFIFAYCYPKKKKQLYLAYARYTVDSDHKVRLTTKTYLSSESWGDSFGNLTSCSRIISMDLSNGHLWICFMNEDDTEVRYFHVLAKDLILE